MFQRAGFLALIALFALVVVAPADAGEATKGLTKGKVELKSAGPITFAPEGILLVGDPAAASVYAIATGDTSGDPEKVSINVEKIDAKVAAALGTKADDILINDMAANPASGNIYLSVSRGRGPDAAVVLLKVGTDGAISEVALNDVPQAKAELPNAPEPGGTGRRNRRSQSITDIEFADGRVIVAGLSNEEFASKLRSIEFPFKSADGGASVEVFHGAHGGYETRSPVRTFTTYNIKAEPHVLAAYTCTPLVKFPLEELKPGEKVRGTTLAELGNRNNPLDMFVYQKDGQDYLLMSNDRRGLMKISTDDIDRDDGITEKINGKAGQTYETIDELEGVVQLSRLNRGNAVVLIKGEGGVDLKTIALP